MAWWAWMILGGVIAIFLLWLRVVTTTTYH